MENGCKYAIYIEGELICEAIGRECAHYSPDEENCLIHDKEFMRRQIYVNNSRANG